MGNALERIETHGQAVEWIRGLINFERSASGPQDYRLDRIRALLQAVGEPHESLPAVHITGTKGKGSTAVSVASVLTAAGVRAGLFTSPHVTRFEERMQVDGEMPQPTMFTSLVRQLHAASLTTQVSPTYFEAATILAWCFFRESHVDVAVLEVGLGGRLDATNVCRPEVCVLTNVSLDHTNVLGNSIESIAREKAGIIKDGVPVISGVGHADGAAVVRDVCHQKNCDLQELGDDIRFTYHPIERDATPGAAAELSATVDVTVGETILEGLPVTLTGRHQAANVALAVAAIEQLRRNGRTIPDSAIRSGLANVRWPLRIETVSTDPLIVVDAAHNDASIRALIAAIDERWSRRPRVAIFATTRHKDAGGMLEQMLLAFDEVILTQYTTNPRAVPVEELQQLVRESDTDATVHTRATPTGALAMARERVGTGLLCVTGSFFVAAEVRSMFCGETPPPEPRASQQHELPA